MSTQLDALLERIEEAHDLLARNGATGEEARRVSEESIQKLIDIGAFRVSAPTKYGGYGLGHKAAMHVGSAVGRADGGTAWVVSILNSGAWYMRLFDDRAQDEVFASGPDVRVSAVVAATGVARRVEGGYRVSGKWFYNSGCWHAQWVLAAVRYEDESGTPTDEGALLIPAGEYTIHDIWHVAGMSSSGSNCIEVNDVFVPEHRAITSSMFGNEDDDDGQDDDDLSREVPYKAAAVPLALLGPQLGLGRAVLDIVVEKAGGKGIAYTKVKRQSDSVGFQLYVARASMMLDTADLVADQAADALDSVDETGNALTLRERAKVRAYVGWAVENVTQAIDLLLTAHGSAAFAKSSPLQRYWRDQAVVARHGYVSPPLSLELYGKAVLGVPDTSGAVL